MYINGGVHVRLGMFDTSSVTASVSSSSVTSPFSAAGPLCSRAYPSWANHSLYLIFVPDWDILRHNVPSFHIYNIQLKHSPPFTFAGLDLSTLGLGTVVPIGSSSSLLWAITRALLNCPRTSSNFLRVSARACFHTHESTWANEGHWPWSFFQPWHCQEVLLVQQIFGQELLAALLLSTDPISNFEKLSQLAYSPNLSWTQYAGFVTFLCLLGLIFSYWVTNPLAFSTVPGDLIAKHQRPHTLLPISPAYFSFWMAVYNLWYFSVNFNTINLFWLVYKVINALWIILMSEK